MVESEQAKLLHSEDGLTLGGVEDATTASPRWGIVSKFVLVPTLLLLGATVALLANVGSHKPIGAVPAEVAERGSGIIEKTQKGACEQDNTSCACFVERDEGFCDTCPNCGTCGDYCAPPKGACEQDDTSCACFVERDEGFCDTCPNCGTCGDYCAARPAQQSIASACENKPESCACKHERASNFCTTCEQFGGKGCGSCDGWCEDNFWQDPNLDVCSWQGSGWSKCLCFWWRDTSFCSTCPGYGGTDCGPCDHWCLAGRDFKECDEPESCACALKRDTNFCNSGIPEKCTEFCNAKK